MRKEPRSIELLSPAKDLICGREAINHGADAVYIGGPDFGILGEGYLRLSYANSTENILKALDRMKEFLATRKAA